MEKRKNLLTLVIALSVTLVIVIGTLVAVIVAGNQSATSRVKVQYTSSDVWVRMEANYYVGSTGTPLKDGSNTSIELSPINTSGSLNQVEDVVTITKENPKIVYEYIFTNLSDTIPAVISQTMVDSAVMVPIDTYNNVTLKYIASSTQLGANASATSETLNSQGLNPSATKYIYVVVEIKNLLYDVLFEGEFGWTLTKGTAITTSTTNSSGNKIINVNTTETGLTNATELNNIQLVLNAENLEPEVYPLVLNKAFTGWYYDSAYSNKVEWPIIVTDSLTLYTKTEDATSGLTYSYSSGSYSVTGYSGSAKDIIIPELYNDGSNGQASVTEIADNAFQNKTAITSVTIPNSVTSIGNYAFQSCRSLTNITIPNSVTSIGNHAFFYCTGLTSITIPNSVTSIGNYAFKDCSSLTSIDIQNGVTSIGSYAFSSCISLTSITIPDSVTSISSSAFYYCTGLTSITIPNSVTSISSSAFSSCRSLTSITIPDSVTSISSYTFSGCSSLTNITIPKGVTSIGGTAFDNCSGLTSIVVNSENTKYDSRNNCNAIIETSTNNLIVGCNNTVIPDTVTSIGYDAFYGRIGLSNIIIPNSVTSIGVQAFTNCSSLTSITIPNSVTSIGSSAFAYCSGLTSITIPTSVTSISGSAFAYCSGLTSITIPDSVTSISGSAFAYCSGLTSVTIPDSVTSIGQSAFARCTGLTSVTIGSGLVSIGTMVFNICSSLTSIKVDSDNTVFDSRSNCNAIIETSTNTLIAGCKNTVIPDSVTSIGDYAFNNCSGLTSITIPNSVTSIGDYAFSGCRGLTSITIPNSVTSIGSSAFSGCSGLTSVTFENTTGWKVATSNSSTASWSSVTIYTEDDTIDGVNGLSANATLLKTTHVTKYWKRS